LFAQKPELRSPFAKQLLPGDLKLSHLSQPEKLQRVCEETLTRWAIAPDSPVF
jgi:hypothetical protein